MGDFERKLEQASDHEAPAREAIERSVGYDDWFIREVEAGLAQIDAGRHLDHDAVGARLEQKLADHPSRR